MQVNQGDSRFLMVGNQIVSLTLNLFFYHNLCCNTQMSHVSPFQTSKSQKLFIGLKDFSIQWILTFEIFF
jgi:hypothetical protein